MPRWPPTPAAATTTRPASPSKGRAHRRTRVTTSTRSQLPEEEQLVYDLSAWPIDVHAEVAEAHGRGRHRPQLDRHRPRRARPARGHRATRCWPPSSAGTGSTATPRWSASAGSEVEYDLSEWDSPARAMLTGRLIEADVPFRWEGGLPRGHRGGRGAGGRGARRRGRRARRRRWPAAERGGAGREPAAPRSSSRSTTWPAIPTTATPSSGLNELFEQSEAGPVPFGVEPVVVGADPRPGVRPARPARPGVAEDEADAQGARSSTAGEAAADRRPTCSRSPSAAVAAVGSVASLRLEHVASAASRTGRSRRIGQRAATLADMLLAELEVWHSRPGHADPAGRARPPGAAGRPARRASAGCCSAPSSPPTCGGVDQDLLPDLHRLINEIERGQRVVQPRLRHRYQVDRHGLARSTHRLIGRAARTISFQFENNGIAAAAGARRRLRRRAARRRRRATPSPACCTGRMRWNGPVGPSLVTYLAGVSGARASSLHGLRRPGGVGARRARLRARHGRARPSREVLAQLPRPAHEVHPDHGGDEVAASKRSATSAEARRILLRRWGSMAAVERAPRRRAAADARRRLEPQNPSLRAIEAAVAPLPVARMDFPYRRPGRKAPDRPPVLLDARREEAARRSSSGPHVAPEPPRARRPVDGRAHVLDGGRRRPPGRRPRARLLPAAPAGPAGQAAHRAPAPPSPCPACSSTAPATRSARPTSSTAATATIPGPVTHEWIEGGRHDLKGADRRIGELVVGLAVRPRTS